MATVSISTKSYGDGTAEERQTHSHQTSSGWTWVPHPPESAAAWCLRHTLPASNLGPRRCAWTCSSSPTHSPQVSRSSFLEGQVSLLQQNGAWRKSVRGGPSIEKSGFTELWAYQRRPLRTPSGTCRCLWPGMSSPWSYLAPVASWRAHASVPVRWSAESGWRIVRSTSAERLQEKLQGDKSERK